MTDNPDTLYIGDRCYSSWSLRAWLLFARFDLEVTLREVDFAKAEVAAQLAHLAPARTVPTLHTGDGHLLWDSLAIAEDLAERFPASGLWPADRGLRALARSLAAEMHSGFASLRAECPMNLRCAYADFTPSDETRADLARIETLWSHALARSGGPWMAGAYSVADAFFAPVAARIAGYGLSVSETAQSYVDAHLSDPAFVRWRAEGLATGGELPWYRRDFPQVPWPGPE
ncbi:glutathione S-transferase [Pseudoponticoccus marisrubri]|uniref:Glutathione S-transferase n=1 Tax=Pseudoponticoccus marisrubri TaxID=1685382 RepID=A0A0W7WPY7_9RHOB|nr:glutathione S-transferase [Pseudoponticoccus marisrubri]KUF12593.1 glutathione S-transferase [Pseudoponticoccus marisrubri]